MNELEINEISKEIEKCSPEIQNYIDFIETALEGTIQETVFYSKVISSMFGLLNFIKYNVGETSDFPIRIDSDFYNDHFLRLLKECQNNFSQVQHLEPLKEDEVF